MPAPSNGTYEPPAAPPPERTFAPTFVAGAFIIEGMNVDYSSIQEQYDSAGRCNEPATSRRTR